MTTPNTPPLIWDTAALTLEFSLSDGPVRLLDVRSSGDQRAVHRPGRQPLVELATAALGQGGDESKLIETPTGRNLRYRSHSVKTTESLKTLVITQDDPNQGLVVESTFEVVRDAPAVRTFTSVSLATGASPVRVLHVSTLATAAVISDDISKLDVWSAVSSPRAENRWDSRPLRALGLRTIDAKERGEYTWSGWQVTGFGARSTLFSAPAGALTNREEGTTFAWQIEHNGSWMWEVGELADRNRGVVAVKDRVQAVEAAGVMQGDSSNDGAFVVLAGPVESRHGWSVVIRDDAPFFTVPASFSVAPTRDKAFGNLANHRRAARRDHPQNATLPVIFNDYMNTLVGDPTEAKLLPLIDAAAKAGADYFCIDAGWYDDTAGWWESVGDWQPSTTRFPNGITSVLDHIKTQGMIPGLWMEPEVIGVTSNAARTLPDTAFITRDGVRVTVNDRHFLDMRQPEARAHVDEAVDRMVNELGAGYFKFDYNITPGLGLDRDSDSLGDGLLQHNRAVISWMRSLIDRYPDLIIEGCSGGGGRSDFATLGELQLVSTSDQENPLAYPAIAIGSLVHILPEQAGNWAYPQADMADHEIAFNMVSGMAGRLYLAGVLNKMNDHQLSLVRAGVDAHNETKHFTAGATPFFPLDFPDWDDFWLAVGFDGNPASPEEKLIIVWALPGATPDVLIPLQLRGATSIERVYPLGALGAGWDATADQDGLRIARPVELPTAAVFRITNGDNLD